MAAREPLLSFGPGPGPGLGGRTLKVRRAIATKSFQAAALEPACTTLREAYLQKLKELLLYNYR